MEFHKKQLSLPYRLHSRLIVSSRVVKLFLFGVYEFGGRASESFGALCARFKFEAPL